MIRIRPLPLFGLRRSIRRHRCRYRLPQHRYRNYLGFAGNDWIDQLGAFVNARFGTERCKDSTFRNDFPSHFLVSAAAAKSSTQPATSETTLGR
jgi:hypothetical protein